MLSDSLVVQFPQIGSAAEGYISVTEMGESCPFSIQRVYWIYGCPDRMQRGGHAHHKLEQMLVCVSGKVEAIFSDGFSKKSFLLNKPTVGLYQPPLVWGDLIYQKDSVLLVLASAPYLAKDYIRDYQDFCQIARSLTD